MKTDAEALPLILVPAAGASRRMRGVDKLLQEIDGVPLLRRQVARAAATDWPVVVTLGPDHEARLRALRGLNVSHVQVDGAEGMAASLRCGAKLARAAGRPLIVVLPDMPDLTSEDLRAFGQRCMIAADLPNRAATELGVPGHPVWLPWRLLDQAQGLHGDQGAKPLLAREIVRLVPLSGDKAITDLDTPEAWEAWRARG